MKYLAYYEIVEAASFAISNNLDELKKEWCFAMRIFEVPNDFTYEKLHELEKPRFPKVKSLYKQIYSEGTLIHESE